MKLKNKVALVTAASKGIGAATAERLAKEGCIVLINYHKDDEAANMLKSKIESFKKGKVYLYKADLTNTFEINAMFSEIKKDFEEIDILVSNAGRIEKKGTILDINEFRDVFEFNLFSHIETINQSLDLMKTGKIVFTSSVHSGIGRGNSDRAIYSASKAAINSYMSNLAKALAPNILVNAVAPGRTITPAWGEINKDEKMELAQDHLTKKWIQPEEVADAIYFLIENDSMCGQVLTIDAGMSLTTLG